MAEPQKSVWSSNYSNDFTFIFGRLFEFPESCNGAALFTLTKLCGLLARRFITFMDELYNHYCCLICIAASSINDLFLGADEGTL